MHQGFHKILRNIIVFNIDNNSKKLFLKHQITKDHVTMKTWLLKIQLCHDKNKLHFKLF